MKRREGKREEGREERKKIGREKGRKEEKHNTGELENLKQPNVHVTGATELRNRVRQKNS